MRYINFFLLFIVALAAIGCDSVGDDDAADTRATGILVVNQGNFSDANGSVTLYDPVEGEVRPAVISDVGSILQSVAVSADRLYLMANTGERIDIFDVETLEQTGQITEIISPRYMVRRGQTGYVSNLYGASGSFSGGKVTILDLDEERKLKEIDVGSNPEGLVLVDDRLYVANFGFGAGNTVSVIDIESEEVASTIDVECDGPRFLVVDDDKDVFVFCTGSTTYDEEGNLIGETDGAVRVLDGTTGAIIERFEIDGRIGAEGPGQDAFFSREEGVIFAVKDQDSVLLFDTDENREVGEIGPFEGDPIGALTYDALREQLYLGRVAGFVEAGVVTIHNMDGAEIDRFTAGISPTYMTWTP